MSLKYILWFSVPFVGIHIEAHERFMDRLLRPRPGAQLWPLDPRYPEVREHLVQMYRQFVTEHGLDGLKLDFVDTFDEQAEESGESPVGRDNMSVAEAAAMLMAQVVDTLRAINPEIVLEFRQPYAGPYMRRCSSIFRVGDVPNDFVANRINSIDLRLLSGSTS